MPGAAAGAPRAGAPQRFRRLMAGASWLAGGRGLATVLSAAWLAVAARHLSAAGFGDLGLLLATTVTITIVSERGLQTAVSIHTARQGWLDSAVLRAAIVRRLPLAALGAAVNAGLYLAVASDRSPLVPAVAAGTILGTAVYSTILCAYHSLGRATAGVANEVLSRLGVLVAGWLWLSHGGGLLAAVSCYALADLVSALAVGLTVPRRHALRSAAAPDADLRFAATAQLAVFMIITTVYYRIDTYLVGALSGSQASGRYAAAYRFLDLVALLPMAIGSLVLAHTVRRTPRERLAAVHRFMVVALALGVPAAIAGLTMGAGLMALVFGPAFADAGPTLAVLLLAGAPTALVAATLPMVLAVDRRACVRLASLTLVANVVANLALVPLWGGVGAAVANLATQLLLAAGAYRAARAPLRREAAAA